MKDIKGERKKRGGKDTSRRKIRAMCEIKTPEDSGGPVRRLHNAAQHDSQLMQSGNVQYEVCLCAVQLK